MRINYKKLKKNIPNRIRTAPRSFYEVLWSEDFFFDNKEDGRKTYGITRFDPQQIVINKNQPDKEAVLTMVHEWFHAYSEEYSVGLTENQVIAMEKGFPALREFILTLEGIIKK